MSFASCLRACKHCASYFTEVKVVTALSLILKQCCPGSVRKHLGCYLPQLLHSLVLGKPPLSRAVISVEELMLSEYLAVTYPSAEVRPLQANRNKYSMLTLLHSTQVANTTQKPVDRTYPDGLCSNCKSAAESVQCGRLTAVTCIYVTLQRPLERYSL
jgi:hypothetical protein